MEQVQLTFSLPRLLSTPENKLKVQNGGQIYPFLPWENEIKTKKGFFYNVWLNNLLPAKKRRVSQT